MHSLALEQRKQAETDHTQILEAFGLNQELIHRVLEKTEWADAQIDSDAYDRTHRGVNRWGHALAALREELRPHGWSWDLNSGLRSVISPDREFQICVASMVLDRDGILHIDSPSTLPKGIHTLNAIRQNMQLKLPLEGDIQEQESLPLTHPRWTWMLLLRRQTISSGEARYAYEVSLPEGFMGHGKRKRVHQWRCRCFRGSYLVKPEIKKVPLNERYDVEQESSKASSIQRKR